MAIPTVNFLPTAPDRSNGSVQYDIDATVWAGALNTWTSEVNVVTAYTSDQAVAALAANVAGNLSSLDLTALAGWVIGVNAAGTALEGVELTPPVQATEIAAGVAELATTAEAQAGADDLAVITSLKLKQGTATLVPALMSAAGAAPIFACRAWATFNGLTGALLSGGNVASVARTAAGVYTVTFTTALPDINYAVSVSSGDATSIDYFATYDGDSKTTTSVDVRCVAPGFGLVDPENYSILIFR